MSEGNKKSLESGNIEKINEMILKFRQCADAATDLSKNVEKFTDIYITVEENVTKLKETERNLNSNDDIKELLDVTNNMKDIFNYFNDNIPQLSKAMQLSKKELDLHKEEFGVLINHFNDMPSQMDNEMEKIKLMLNEYSIYNKDILQELEAYVEEKDKKVESKNSRTKKAILEEIKKQLESGLENFQKETLKMINDSVNEIIDEKVNFMVNKFEAMANNFYEARDSYNYPNQIDTIYNLYIANRKKLPMDVRKTDWSSNFYFTIEKIEQPIFVKNSRLIAYGKRFQDHRYYDNYRCNANLDEFVLYNPNN